MCKYVYWAHSSENTKMSGPHLLNTTLMFTQTRRQEVLLA